MDNNQTQNAMSGFLGAVDALRGLLVDALNGDKLGSAPTGTIGVLGAMAGIEASIDKYNSSGKTAEDFATRAEHFAQTVNKLKGKVTILFITHQLPKGLQVDEAVVLGKTETIQEKNHNASELNKAE